MIGIQTKMDDFGVKRVTGVETSAGLIKTNCVVNCAGKVTEARAAKI